MNDVKEAINWAPKTAKAHLYTLAHEYARKAFQDASKLVKDGKLEQSDAKSLEKAVFENFKKTLSYVSLY